MRKPLWMMVAGAVFFVSFGAIPSAHAALSPVSLALIHHIEFPPEDFTIVGARVSVFWGQHRQVYGLDVGAIGNMTEQEFGGIGVSGVFNATQGTATIVGLQAAGVFNSNTGKMHLYGLQVAPINNNQGEGNGLGIEAGLANLSPHTSMGGLQVGVYNRVHEIYGFQFGLVNVADSVHGIQVGLLNFDRAGLFIVSPIINIGF